MIPFPAQRGPITNTSSLNSMYASLLGETGPNPNHLLPNIYQQKIIDSYINNLFLQNPELLLLEQLLITQSQSQACLSGQLWQNLVAQAAAAKSKELMSDASNYRSNPYLDTWKKNNESSEITRTPLNQNLEASAIKKINSTSIKARQKHSQTPTVSPQGSKTLFEKEAGEDGRKKIQKNYQEPRNQLEVQTRPHTLIQPLDPNDCAFDSNGEHDLKDSEKESLEKSKTTPEKRAQLSTEVLKDVHTIIQRQNELIGNNKDEKLIMSDEKEKDHLEHHNQLQAHELDELDSSFSSDDWPSLNGDSECENPLQD